MTNKIIPSFKKSKLADRGKSAETAVDKFLSLWAGGHANREFNRLLDTKAAGRIIKAAAADFEFFARSPAGGAQFGLIEVKETEHEHRLARPKVPQLPRMVKRAKAGGLCLVIVHHSTIKKWRVVDVDWLSNNGDKGSWNLHNLMAFDTPAEALRWLSPTLFLL